MSAHSDCETGERSDDRLDNKPKLELKKCGMLSEGLWSQDPNYPNGGCLGMGGIVGGVP
ncbi:hypothetical protein AM1_C0222 (plasmid) [Acaryochloris marina MBIC11017]|uniref:Uncharacterized protein n=1 Tax=Acaryochloris marina (strain MBIC 11017) TaxID=329726 RepID=A8ZMV7_ACAM1|nr:hypothetical protein AM1_C0222 [Acaryochloris marina MBIC11017]